MKCDFCSEDRIAKTFECRHFDATSTVAGITYGGKSATLHSRGGWAACAACARLVEAGDLEGLIRRALDAPYRKDMLARLSFAQVAEYNRSLGEHLRLTYRLFFENLVLSYRLNDEETAITCLICGLTSWHPKDVHMRFCGHCHRFHDELKQTLKQ